MKNCYIPPLLFIGPQDIWERSSLRSSHGREYRKNFISKSRTKAWTCPSRDTGWPAQPADRAGSPPWHRSQPQHTPHFPEVVLRKWHEKKFLFQNQNQQREHVPVGTQAGLLHQRTGQVAHPGTGASHTLQHTSAATKLWPILELQSSRACR